MGLKGKKFTKDSQNDPCQDFASFTTGSNYFSFL